MKPWTTDDPKIEKTEFYDPMNKRVMALRAGAPRSGTPMVVSLKQTTLIPKFKFYASNVDGEVSSDPLEYEQRRDMDNDLGGDTTGKGYGYRMYEPDLK